MVLHARVREPVANAAGSFVVKEKILRWEPAANGDHHLRHVEPALVPGGDPPGRRAGTRHEPDDRGGAGQGRLDHPRPQQLHGRLQRSPRAETGARLLPRPRTCPQHIGEWCNKIPAEEKGIYPIDQSDGGCDDGPQCPQGSPWKSQIAAIEIHDEDAISDSGAEIWNLLESRGNQQRHAHGRSYQYVRARPAVRLAEPGPVRQERRPGPRPDRHDVQLAEVALRQPFRGNQPDRRAHREVRRPDDHLDRPDRPARVPVPARRSPPRRLLDR